jgi:hypothetical protein
MSNQTAKNHVTTTSYEFILQADILPLIQWVPGTVSPGVKQSGHGTDHSSPSVKNGATISPLPHGFMVWYISPWITLPNLTLSWYSMLGPAQFNLFSKTACSHLPIYTVFPPLLPAVLLSTPSHLPAGWTALLSLGICNLSLEPRAALVPKVSLGCLHALVVSSCKMSVQHSKLCLARYSKSLFWPCFTSILSRFWSDYRQGLDWWMDLLTTYTHDSELQTRMSLSLIYTLYKSLQQMLSFSFV